ncbi:MAG TPA: hypothetical protein VML94_04480 [Thermoplasmata archaeon]|nr:hypothetical protein [Thermoplasmata archaeon]
MSDIARRRIVPAALGIAMLAVVVAAAFVPNVGTVQAATNCPYGNCSTPSSSFPTWELASIGAIVVLFLLVGLFVLMRRRRPPASEAPYGGSAAGGAPPSGAMEAGPAAPYPEEPASAAYVETPEDVAAPPPTISAPPAVGAAGAGAGAASAEAEPDIDSLMAELDKISGEILKRTPKKGSTAPPDDDDAPSN